MSVFFSGKFAALTPYTPGEHPRALDAKEYAKVYSARGIDANGYESLDLAVYDALAYAKENGKTVLSLGSLYMYCEIIEALKKQK